MALTKVLIAVKTYPTLSKKYDELVCTAGFREDGSWIRIYPVPFRKLGSDEQYSKWQWVELDLVKNAHDYRKESYRPADIDKPINTLAKIGTEHGWAERKEWVLRKVYTNMEELIKEAKDVNIGTSLAVFKPKKVIDFVWEACEREWDKATMRQISDHRRQYRLFDADEPKQFRPVRKLPYEFSYKFISDDGKERKLMIEDWELGKLFWNCLATADGDEQVACRKVKEKYFNYMCHRKDFYFFLGTTLRFHQVGLNPFIIIGTFYPPIDTQLSFPF